MRVLVTGAAGFIGAHAVRTLRARGHDVRGVDLHPAPGVAVADLRDPTTVERIDRRTAPDAVLHLAALASVPLCEADPEECLRSNLLATTHLARAAGERAARFVFASTAAVYGDDAPLPTPVRTPAQPTNLYGISKLAGEEVVRLYDPEAVVLRLFNVYGEGCDRSYVIPDLIRRLATRPRELVMSGTARVARDFVYVEDVLRAMDLSLRASWRGTYNVGSGVRTSLASLAREVARRMGLPQIRVRFTGARPGDFRANHAALGGGNSVPTWRPQISLREGLDRMIAHSAG